MTGCNSSVPIVASFANTAVSNALGHPLLGNCSTNYTTNPNWGQTFVTWREKKATVCETIGKQKWACFLDQHFIGDPRCIVHAGSLTRVLTKRLPTGSIWFPTAVRKQRWRIPGARSLLARVLVSFWGVDLGLQGETRKKFGGSVLEVVRKSSRSSSCNCL